MKKILIEIVKILIVLLLINILDMTKNQLSNFIILYISTGIISYIFNQFDN